MNPKHLLVATFATLLASTAHAAVVLNQNFQTCPSGSLGNSGQLVVTAGVCGVSSIAFSGDSNANAANVRLGANAINGTTTNLQTFDGFFGMNPNRFLVIGDISGNIGGEPNGQPGGATTVVNFGLGSFAAGQHALSVVFDYVFDTNSTAAFNSIANSSPDDFRVSLVDAGGNQVGSDVLFHGSVTANASATRALGYSWGSAVTLAAPGALFLRFSLTEFNGNSSSAVGIDNLTVSAVQQRGTVPVPGTLALIGAALLGLGATRRLKR